MSEQAVHIINVAVGAVGTANRTLYRVPAGYGGITLLNVWLVSDTAATIVSQLANMGTGLGTAVSSAIGTLTDGTMVANVRKAYTISTAYQAAGTWLGLNGISGTVGSASQVIIEFKYGK
jgi:hypothetical protein